VARGPVAGAGRHPLGLLGDGWRLPQRPVPGTALRITEAGRAAIGEIDPVPSGEPLFQWWVSNPVLGRAERAILATLYQARGGEMSQQAVGEATNYSPTAGGFRNALSKLRTLRVIEGPGAGMRISADML
jgi:hypothetical protein